MKIVEWAKAHPWTTGAVIVGGGLTFILISGWFGGGGGGQSVSVGSANGGMSDAEVAAAAQIQAAQIQANAYGAQAQYQLQSDQLMANLYGQQAAYDYNLGLKQLDVGKDLTLAQINSQNINSYLSSYTAVALNQQQTQQNLALIQSNTKKKSTQKAVTSIVQAAQNTFPSYTQLVGGTPVSNPVTVTTPSAVSTGSFGGTSGPSITMAQV